jgi:hypothetical protein
MATLRFTQRLPSTGVDTISSGDSILNSNFSTELLDTTQAFMVFGNTGVSDAGGRYLTGGGIIDTVSYQYLRPTTNPENVRLVGYVAEFTDGVVVERGNINFLLSTNVSATLSSISDETKAFVTVFRDNTAFGSNMSASLFPAVWLASDAGSSEINLECASAAFLVARWQVVEYDDCFVQRGNTTMSAGGTTVTAALTSAVDQEKSFLLFNYTLTDDDTVSNQAGKMLVGKIDNTTQISFSRDRSGPTVPNIRWEVVEFLDNVTVQEVSATFASGENSAIVAINAVTSLTGAIVFCGAFGRQGNMNNNTGDFYSDSLYMADLSATNSLSFTRDNSGDTSDLIAYVVDFAASAAVVSTPEPSLVRRSITTGAGGAAFAPALPRLN